MTRPALVLATVLVLALSGCSGDSADDDRRATAASAAPAPADPGGGSYAGTAEVVAALEDAGLPCEEPQEGTYEGVSQAQGCILSGTEDVVVLHFASPAERQGYLDTKDELASAVVGEDWAVQTVLQQTAQQVADALGGEVVLGATA